MDQISISSAQVRAARGLLNWTQSELAERCDLTKATIANIENEKHHLTSKTATKIFQAFSNAKIEFLGNEGLRNKMDVIKTLEGRVGLTILFDEIYESVRKKGGFIKVSGVDESLFQEMLDSNYISMHSNRMQKVKNLRFRALISNKDCNVHAKKYVEYAAIPFEYFFPLPIYIYDRKVAFVAFDPLRVVFVENFNLFLAHSNQFDLIWEKASNPL